MSRRSRHAFLIGVLLCSILAMGTGLAEGGSWYLGLGPELGRISSEEKTLLDGFEGAGLVLTGGYRFNPLIALELCFSGPMGAASSHSIFSLGTKFDFLDLRSGTWTPWAALYISAHMLEWDDSDTKGDSLGFSAGLGADILISENSSIQPAVRYHSFDVNLKGAGGTGLGTHESTAVELTVAYVYHFWE